MKQQTKKSTTKAHNKLENLLVQDLSDAEDKDESQKQHINMSASQMNQEQHDSGDSVSFEEKQSPKQTNQDFQTSEKYLEPNQIEEEPNQFEELESQLKKLINDGNVNNFNKFFNLCKHKLGAIRKLNQQRKLNLSPNMETFRQDLLSTDLKPGTQMKYLKANIKFETWLENQGSIRSTSQAVKFLKDKQQTGRGVEFDITALKYYNMRKINQEWAKILMDVGVEKPKSKVITKEKKDFILNEAKNDPVFIALFLLQWELGMNQSEIFKIVALPSQALSGLKTSQENCSDLLKTSLQDLYKLVIFREVKDENDQQMKTYLFSTYRFERQKGLKTITAMNKYFQRKLNTYAGSSSEKYRANDVLRSGGVKRSATSLNNYLKLTESSFKALDQTVITKGEIIEDGQTLNQKKKGVKMRSQTGKNVQNVRKTIRKIRYPMKENPQQSNESKDKRNMSEKSQQRNHSLEKVIIRKKLQQNHEGKKECFSCTKMVSILSKMMLTKNFAQPKTDQALELIRPIVQQRLNVFLIEFFTVE